MWKIFTHKHKKTYIVLIASKFKSYFCNHICHVKNEGENKTAKMLVFNKLVWLVNLDQIIKTSVVHYARYMLCWKCDDSIVHHLKEIILQTHEIRVIRAHSIEL